MSKESKSDNSKLAIAVILIVIGVLWTLKEVGVNFHFEQIFAPFTWVFSRLGRIIFSWPMVLLIIGLLLVSGKHSWGWVLVALGGFFIIPRVFALQPFSFALVFPLVVLLTGVLLITRK